MARRSRIMPPPLRGERLAMLCDAGELLFGKRWKAPMARAMGIHIMTLHEWLADRRPVPRARLAQIIGMLEAHRLVLSRRMLLAEGLAQHIRDGLGPLYLGTPAKPFFKRGGERKRKADDSKKV